MKIQLNRANPETGVEEHYCRGCEQYHPLKAFHAGVLERRMHICKEHAKREHNAYRRSMSREKTRCYKMLQDFRRRECQSEESKRLEVSDVMIAVEEAKQAGAETWPSLLKRKDITKPLSSSNLVAIVRPKGRQKNDPTEGYSIRQKRAGITKAKRKAKKQTLCT